MPPLSRAMVRAALIWQGLGFLVGSLMLAAKAGAAPGQLLALRDAHVHILLAGWLVQFAAGVAYWIMPRHDAAGDRGDPRPMLAGALALNAGVALTLLIGAGRALGADLSALAVLAGALYAAGFVLPVAHLWPRVLPFRNLPRPGREPADTHQEKAP